MANPLTGDHDAVVQVSVGTLNRLLATMHQNEGTGTYLPTLPHSAFVRVGDDPDTRVDGVQGVVRLQAGVPWLEVLHLAQDRVVVHAWLRNWFTPSSGSAPFPEFSYGTVRAEYALLEIPGIGGQGTIQGTYQPPRFRFEVDPNTVSFTSAGDTSHDAAITRQIVALLQTTFAMPGGHPMLGELMDRKLISLSTGGEQALAIALELGPDPFATEQPSHVTNLLTAGKDFAVAASGDYIVSLLRPQLDSLEATTTTVQIDMVVDTAVYTIDITSATVQWGVDVIAAGATTTPCGALDLDINGAGTAPDYPDGTFRVRQRILLAFNPATQSLFLLPKGGPVVNAHIGDIGIIESVVEDEIETIYNAQITAALAAANPHLATTSGMKDGITHQLQLSDDQAAASLDSAEFTPDGLVLRGSVSLAPRRHPMMHFDPLPDLSGYSAFLSWFPGGRITGFYWWWQPMPQLPGDPPGIIRQSHDDRFVVRPDYDMPGLPALSGGAIRAGRVCLDLWGLVIDPVTGAEVPLLARDCVSVQGPPPPPPPWWLKEVDSVPVWWRLWAEGEVGIVEAGRGRGQTEPFNTLVYHVKSGPEPANLAAIVEGIDGAARDDAGLLVLTVVPEGAIDEMVAVRVHEAAPHSDVEVRVIEDISGGWARAFQVAADAGDALRLVTADGELAWSHDGMIAADALSDALREHLVPSAPPQFAPLRPETGIGQPAPPVYLEVSPGEPLSLARMRGRPVTLCFALPWSDSSLEAMSRLDNAAERADGFTAVVLTDGDADAAAAIARSRVSRAVVMPDPHRSVTNAFGVYMWPTTITIDESGIVSSVTSVRIRRTRRRRRPAPELGIGAHASSGHPCTCASG